MNFKMIPYFEIIGIEFAGQVFQINCKKGSIQML